MIPYIGGAVCIIILAILIPMVAAEIRRATAKPIDPEEGAWAGYYGNLDNMDGLN